MIEEENNSPINHGLQISPLPRPLPSPFPLRHRSLRCIFSLNFLLHFSDYNLK